VVKGVGVNEVPMEIVVLGRHVEVPDALREAATKKTDRLSRYLAGMERAEVCFSNTPIGHLGDPVTCEIVLEGHGHVVRVAGAGSRPTVALDSAVGKAELQLTRLKRKLVGRSRPRHGNGKRMTNDGAPEGFDRLEDSDGPDDSDRPDDIDGPDGSDGPDDSDRPDDSDGPDDIDERDSLEGITEL
jgi:ribosomal subunit interface protein